MPPELAEVLRWLGKADHDRRAAEIAVAEVPPLTDVAAFHCQQAVEKLFKAYLLFHEVPFEKVHDLRELARQCAEYDALFSGLEPRVSPLTPYAVRFRYPGPYDPSVQEVEQALSVVREVWQFVLERLPEEVRP